MIDRKKPKEFKCPVCNDIVFYAYCSGWKVVCEIKFREVCPHTCSTKAGAY